MGCRDVALSEAAYTRGVLRNSLAELGFLSRCGAEFHVRVSAGVQLAPPLTQEAREELVHFLTDFDMASVAMRARSV